MVWGRIQTWWLQLGDRRVKEGAGKEGKQRGSQVSNAREKGRVKDGNMTYGNKQAEAERSQKGDKEKQM